MFVLVRIVHHAPSGGRIQHYPDANDPAHVRGHAHDGLPQMGDDDFIHHSSVTKRHLTSTDVHLPTQAAEPGGQGETGQRIPAAHGCTDAGKQV